MTDRLQASSVELMQFDANEIRAQLTRILRSGAFDVPDRAKRFLSYVVEEAIVGRADRIKAFSVATDVFGRDVSFDARTDPIVRIEAGRIRRALERYYLTAGSDDPIVITVPKGGYIPVFARRDRASPSGEVPAENRIWRVARLRRGAGREWQAIGVLMLVVVCALTSVWILRTYIFSPAPLQDRADVRSATPADVPRLLVEIFQDVSGTQSAAMIARGLTEEVVAQIAKFKEIVVVFDRSGTPRKTILNDDRAGEPYSLSGSLQMGGDKLRLSVRLDRSADGSVLWANTYNAEMKVPEIIDVQIDIARKVASALAQPYGVIHYIDAAQASRAPPEDWGAYACILAYYTYRRNVGPDSHVSVRECLQRTIEQYPQYATAWALLSLSYVDEVRFAYRVPATTPAPLDRALETAERAVHLDPHNVRGLQAKMTALFFRKEIDAALQVGATAIAMNPNDMELAGEYGIRLALTGNWRQGRELIETAIDRDPQPLGYLQTVIALCFYMEGDYESAVNWVRQPGTHTNVIYHLVAAAIYGQVRDLAGAAAEADWLRKNAPDLVANVREELAMRNIREEDQIRFIEGLRKGGFLVPDPTSTLPSSATEMGNPAPKPM